MSIFLMLMLVPDVGMRMRHASQERLLHMASRPRPPSATPPAKNYRADRGSAEDTLGDRPASTCERRWRAQPASGVARTWLLRPVARLTDIVAPACISPDR